MAMKKMAPSDVKYIAVHCSATKAHQDFHAEDIDRWHRAKGWAKIGYHGVIARDGTLEGGRPLDEPGAHVQGYNHESIGICMVGGLDAEGEPENNFTVAQFDTLHDTLKNLLIKFPLAEIKGHRDFPGVKKACPCFSVRDWLSTNLSTYGESK